VIGPSIALVLSVLFPFLESLLVFDSGFDEDPLDEPLVAPPDGAFYPYEASYCFNDLQRDLLRRSLVPLIRAWLGVLDHLWSDFPVMASSK
jgi:hypothetical protein